MMRFIKKQVQTISLLGITTILFGYFTYIYYLQATSFSFVDEFNNFITAYYMLEGKNLFTEIFFNHNPLPAYMSYLLQYLFTPESLYQLVIYHRLTVSVFSFIMALLLVYRFSFVGLFFVFMFEITKFYLFGNLFLAESFIVYPLAYLFGLGWEKLSGKELSFYDFMLSAVFTWFTVFSREPYVPVALVLFGVVLFNRQITRKHIIALLLFILLSVSVIVLLPLKDFFFQVVQVNYLKFIANGGQSGGKSNIFLMLFYPLSILWYGQENYFRIIQIVFAVLFVKINVYYLLIRREILIILYVFIILALAAVRFEPPGTEFYEAYHMLPWYSIFIMAISLLFVSLYDKKQERLLAHASVLGCLLVLLITFASPRLFIYERKDRNVEFTTNYGQYAGITQLLNILSQNTNTTLFVEGWDSLVFWKAEVKPAYKYVYFYPVMGSIPAYDDPYKEMMRQSPPDFYYAESLCGVVKKKSQLPELVKSTYRQIFFENKPTCLLIRSESTPKIEEKSWEQAKELGFEVY